MKYLTMIAVKIQTPYLERVFLSFPFFFVSILHDSLMQFSSLGEEVNIENLTNSKPLIFFKSISVSNEPQRIILN